LDGEAKPKKPERFRIMINRNAPVCQAINTRPSLAGIYERA